MKNIELIIDSDDKLKNEPKLRKNGLFESSIFLPTMWKIHGKTKFLTIEILFASPSNQFQQFVAEF